MKECPVQGLGILRRIMTAIKAAWVVSIRGSSHLWESDSPFIRCTDMDPASKQASHCSVSTCVHSIR